MTRYLPIRPSLVAVVAVMLGLSLGLASCRPAPSPRMVSGEQLPVFQQETLRELEKCTGLRWKPQPVAFQLMRCSTQDDRGPCWRWAGHYLVGATTLGQPAPTIRICSCDLKQVHKDVVRHELLHVLLLQHGISGHPDQYTQCATQWDSEEDEVPAGWEVHAPPRPALVPGLPD